MDMPADQQDRAIDFARQASLGLPSSIKQVADFLLAEGTGIADLTMAEIAARTYTSKPTLVRFAKQAGYAGWKDYRHDFLIAMATLEEERIRIAEVDVNRPFDIGSSAVDVIDGITRIHQLAITETMWHLDCDVLEQAARAIVTAHDVAFLGAMQNYHRGKVFASNLGIMGILCRTPIADEVAFVARNMGEGDCAVVASYSGDLNHMPMRFVPELKQRGVIIVAITGVATSDLSACADHVLYFPALEHYHAKIGAFYSGTCTTLALESLYASCYAQRYEKSSAQREAILEDLRDVIPADLSG